MGLVDDEVGLVEEVGLEELGELPPGELLAGGVLPPLQVKTAGPIQVLERSL